MLRHYLLLIYRNFRRFKSTFFINLLGLSTGLACALLIYLWVRDEASVDKFHEKDARLFQVIQNYPIGETFITIESTPDPLAKSLEEEVPEIEAAVKFTEGWDGPQGIISVGESRTKAQELYVSPNFLNVFSYKLLAGNKEDVLKNKYSVLLSDELALKLFHTTENLIGKDLEWSHGRISASCTITGIFSKVPSNSTARFDLLFNYEIYQDAVRSLIDMDSWENSNPGTCVVLKEGTDVNILNDKIKNFCKEKFIKTNPKANADFVGTFFLQKYSDRYLYNNYENGVPSGGRISYVKLFSIIAIFILLIACINFMNLSTAKASRRIKEIGIKKAIGAQRKSLILQYMLESVFMAFLSLSIAILMADLLIVPFNQITGKNIILSFEFDLVLSALLITLFTGIIAGSYPALYLSGFNPAIVLKGKLVTSIGEAWTRQGLVVFQFAISVVLIVSVVVVYKQVSFIQSKNLGFNRDHIIQFSSEGKLSESFDAFKTEALGIPGVAKVTSCAVNSILQNTNSTGGVIWEGKKADQKMKFGNLEIGDDFMEALEMKIIEGRTFSKGYEAEKSKIIFNKTAISSMGLSDPVGKTVKLWGEERQIIGVVEDFHFESLYEKVKPCFVIYNQQHLQNILVKIEAGKEADALASIEKLYRRFNPGLVFDYTFLDSNYQEIYASERRVAVLSKYFAGIAIILSCLGLFGLAAFTAERRLKEIGIRKVLGASEIGIIALLSGSFSRIVFVAVIIALPVSYLAANYWLNNFAYRITLQWWYFAAAGLIAMVIAWLTVGTQALKAARINPTKCLKDE